MTPYARHMALCRIVWLDPETDERNQTPPFWPHDLESRMAMVRRFGKPLYLIRCHEWPVSIHLWMTQATTDSTQVNLTRSRADSARSIE